MTFLQFITALLATFSQSFQSDQREDQLIDAINFAQRLETRINVPARDKVSILDDNIQTCHVFGNWYFRITDSGDPGEFTHNPYPDQVRSNLSFGECSISR